MKFYNRVAELDSLQQVASRSLDHAQFTLVSGRRRVGKTSLVLKAYQKAPCLYLFVSRKSEALLCAEYQQSAADVLGLTIFGKVNTFRDFFEQLLRYSEHHQMTVIIDEFQDFERVNPAIFSDIQDVWDRYKDTALLNLVVSGSLYSLLVRIFESNKEPLFGRLSSKIIVQPFVVDVVKKILRDHNAQFKPEDLLCLYLLTGGVPKYVSLLMDAKAVTRQAMLDFVCAAGSPFLGEGKEVLVSEFGKDYSIYFSILQLIASGKTAQSEIDSILGKSTGTYLRNLSEEYSLISKNRPLFSKPASRNVRWKVDDLYLRFWFRFVYAHQTLVETGRTDLLRELVEKGYSDYSGLVLEDYFRAKYREEGRFTAVGAWWDRKGEHEIDLVALSELDRTAVVAEVKRNPDKLSLPQLQKKAEKLSANLGGYDVQCELLSIEDM